VTEATIAEKAERLTQRRARVLFVLAIIYLMQQASYFSNSAGAIRTVDSVKISAWLVLSIVLLFGIVTKGFWFQPKEVRDLIDDENTRANRLDAMRVGFILAMLGAIATYVLTLFEPVSGREAVHIILSVGIGAALLRMALLERRAHRNG
jgi:ABC-type Fe3+ transport system permease subunit